MAKYIYPAIFTAEDGGFSIRFPDIENCFTSAENLQEGMDMANDALCLTLYWMEKDGEAIPKPSDINQVAHGPDELVTLIACDTSWYKRFYDSKAVKKTLSIPAWLNDMAEKAGVNFSATLQSALKQQLHIAE